VSVADLETSEAVVVLHDRPLLALMPWLADLLEDSTSSGRVLQLVTSMETRASHSVRLAGATWVVRDEAAAGGYYEALTGRPMLWTGAAFAPVPDARDYAPGFLTRPADAVGSQLGLTFRARHAGHGVLGGQVEHLITALTGRPPIGWGPAEPVAHAWDRASFTRYVRDRTQTRLIVVGGEGGRTAIASVEFAADGSEVTTLTVGFPPSDPPPTAHLPALIGTLAAEAPVSSLLAQLSPGRADVTFEPRWMGMPAPLGLAVAGERPGIPGIPASLVGPAQVPMTWFELGDGRSQDGWQRHQELLRQLLPS
jgi:uncharacterized protein DUF6177